MEEARLRIAIVSPSDYATFKGGVELHSTRLHAAINTIGHDAELYFGKESAFDPREFDWIIFEGVFRGPLSKLVHDNRFKTVKKAIFTHGSFYSYIHAAELKRIGYREPDRLDFYRRALLVRLLGSRILRHFDAIFTLSETESKELIHFFNVDKTKFHSLPNFVTVQPIEKIVFENSPWQKFAPYICAVGRVDYRKNFQLAIEASRRLKLGFVLAGRDAGYLDRLKKEANDSGAKNFTYIGEIGEDEKRSLISGSLATILPSFFEGYPFSVLESLMLGKPAIVTTHSYMHFEIPGLVYCTPTLESVTNAITVALQSQVAFTETSLPLDLEIAKAFILTLEGN